MAKKLKTVRDYKCGWFALCKNKADKFREHPILGSVPICNRCDAKVATLEKPRKNPSKRRTTNPLSAALRVLKAAEAAHYNKNPVKRTSVNDLAEFNLHRGITYKLQERRGNGWHTICTMTDMTRDQCVKAAKKYHSRHKGKKLRLFY